LKGNPAIGFPLACVVNSVPTSDIADLSDEKGGEAYADNYGYWSYTSGHMRRFCGNQLPAKQEGKKQKSPALVGDFHPENFWERNRHTAGSLSSMIHLFYPLCNDNYPSQRPT
jgi:hypothetical protein